MLKFFFFYTKGERNGICILLVLIFMMFAINFCMPLQSEEEQLVSQLIQQKDSVSSAFFSKKEMISSEFDPESFPSPQKANKERPTNRSTKEKRISQKTLLNDRHNANRTCQHFNYDTVRIEINKADTTEWKRLRGIGSVLSQRIVKYRDKCGGFHSIEQLKKIYGLSEETYQAILPHLWMDSCKYLPKQQ